MLLQNMFLASVAWALDVFDRRAAAFLCSQGIPCIGSTTIANFRVASMADYSPDAPRGATGDSFHAANGVLEKMQEHCAHAGWCVPLQVIDNS